MTLLAGILIALALLSIVLNLWQWFVATRFPLHKKVEPGQLDSVTLLKPLKGCDAQTRSCLESWLTQTYPATVQILFGVASATDPVCAIVEELIAKYPHGKLIICEEQFGANAKVSTLVHLQRFAVHRFLVVSDADVFVPPDFLAQVMIRFKSPQHGLVNCFYQLTGSRNLAMEWEAIAVNADFWSQVLQGISMKPMDFALGAVMAVRKEALEKIGGFFSVVNHLADDYQLGHQIAHAGFKVDLADVVATCRGSEMSFGEVWSHQLRWARTIRVCQPIPWFFSILSNATLWPLLAAAIVRSRLALAILAIALSLRIVTALHNQMRITESIVHAKYFWLVPIKDLLGTAIWACSFLGSTVVWRGVRYRVKPGGTLVPV